jgi:hypothetical protein
MAAFRPDTRRDRATVQNLRIAPRKRKTHGIHGIVTESCRNRGEKKDIVDVIHRTRHRLARRLDYDDRFRRRDGEIGEIGRRRARGI